MEWKSCKIRTCLEHFLEVLQKNLISKSHNKKSYRLTNFECLISSNLSHREKHIYYGQNVRAKIVTGLSVWRISLINLLSKLGRCLLFDLLLHLESSFAIFVFQRQICVCFYHFHQLSRMKRIPIFNRISYTIFPLRKWNKTAI